MATYSNDEGSLARPTLRKPEASRKSRSRALVFLLVALLAGITAAWLISRTLARSAAKTTPTPMTKVAVAAMDLPLATTLRPEMVDLIDWPIGSVPQGAVSNAKAIDGRVTNSALVKGDLLVESRLAPEGAGQGMAAIIPANMRAMTVRVNEVIGVGGFIHPGDMVDVLTTMQVRTANLNEYEFRSKIVLQFIRVLAIGEDMVVQNAKPVKVPVVTLLVTPEESERLALAATKGDLQLTMRSVVDNTLVETAGTSPPELLMGKGDADDDAPTARRSSRRRAEAKPAPEKPAEPEVVEVIRGDRFEERKMRPKEPR